MKNEESLAEATAVANSSFFILNSSLSEKQIAEKNYAEPYKFDSRILIKQVIIVDVEKRMIVI